MNENSPECMCHKPLLFWTLLVKIYRLHYLSHLTTDIPFQISFQRILEKMKYTRNSMWVSNTNNKTLIIILCYNWVSIFPVIKPVIVPVFCSSFFDFYGTYVHLHDIRWIWIQICTWWNMYVVTVGTHWMLAIF